MLTGEGLIGKAITTIVVKIGSKLLALPFDKRRDVAQILTKLYFAIVRLEEVSEQFLDIFDRFSKGTNESEALLTAIRSQSQSIDAASETLAALSDEIYDALLILDPVLANCLNFLKTGKENFLSFLSNSVRLSSQDGRPKLEVEIPNARIMSTDFESIYEFCKQKREMGEKYYWPEGVFDYFNDFEYVEILFDDPRAAAELTSMIRHQSDLLKEARESLRVLLKNSLTLEEVFSASKKKKPN
jgi:hypothetical protein